LTLPFFLAAPAQADPITFIFGGRLSIVDPELRPKFSIGENFFGRFTYESSTPPTDRSNSENAFYLAAVTHFSVNFGVAGLEYEASLANGETGDIVVNNLINTDTFVVQAGMFSLVGDDSLSGPSVGGLPPVAAVVNIFSPLGVTSGFDSAIPLPTSLPPEIFSEEALYLYFGTQFQALVAGPIFTRSQIDPPPFVAPEPGSLTLLALGAGIVAAFRRCKRDKRFSC
jgi:hypothetical protein